MVWYGTVMVKNITELLSSVLCQNMSLYAFLSICEKIHLKKKQTNNAISVTPKAHFHSTTYLLSLRNVFTEHEVLTLDNIVGRIVSTPRSPKPATVAKGTPQI